MSMEFWFSEMQTPDVKMSIRVNRQLYSGKSEFQRIDVFESPQFGRFLTLDGYMMLTERDEFIYHDMIVHVPMAVHPAVRDVLVIGAGDGGVIRELTRYFLSAASSETPKSRAISSTVIPLKYFKIAVGIREIQNALFKHFSILSSASGSVFKNCSLIFPACFSVSDIAV